MIHNIFYDKKHKEYTNICITHSYVVMSEFYKSIPELVYSLREVATIFIEDKLPKMTKEFETFRESKDTKEQAVELFPSDLFYALQKYAIKKSEIEDILERIAL